MSDGVATSSGTIIGSSQGSFTTITGLTSETDSKAGANQYSLQLNSQVFGTETSYSMGNPAQGWEQFIYTTTGEAFIQFWLIGYQSAYGYCPDTVIPGGTPWMTSSGSCYANSPAITAPTVLPTSLGTVTLSGFANYLGSGLDEVEFCVSLGDCYSTTVTDGILDLSNYWLDSEFNVFGAGSGSQAMFNGGTTIGVATQITDQNGKAIAPSCTDTSYTEESDNLDLGPCGTNSSGITFSESSPVSTTTSTTTTAPTTNTLCPASKSVPGGSYQVIFCNSGPAIFHPTVQYSISNGTDGSGTSPLAINVGSGLKLAYNYTLDVDSGIKGLRYSFVSVNHKSPQTIIAPLNVTAIYQSEYQVSFKQVGSAIPPTVTYSVSNGSMGTGVAPGGVWIYGSGGLTLTYTYQKNPSAAADVNYTLVNASASKTISVTKPLNVTMIYEKLIGLGSDPYSSTYDPNNNEIYVTNYLSNTVSVIDGTPGSPTENTVNATINVGLKPTWLAYDNASDELFVVNSGSDTVSVISTSTNSVVTTISSSVMFGAGRNLSGIAYDRINENVYVVGTCYPYGSPACSGSALGGVVMIDGDTNLGQTIGRGICAGSSPAIDTTDDLVFVADYCLSDDQIVVISGSSNEFFTQSGPDSQQNADPLGMVYDPSNDNVYVSNPGSDTVTAIDASQCSISNGYCGASADCSPSCAETVIEVGGEPDGLALDTSNGEIYVTNDLSNATSAIDPVSNTVVANISTPIGGTCGSYYCARVFYDPADENVYVTSPHLSFVSVIAGNVSSAKQNTVIRKVPTLLGSYLGQDPFDPENGDLYVLDPSTPTQVVGGVAENSLTVIYTGTPGFMYLTPDSAGVQGGFTASSEATLSGPTDDAYLTTTELSGCGSSCGAPNPDYFSVDWNSNPVLLTPDVEDGFGLGTTLYAPTGTYGFLVTMATPSGDNASWPFTLTIQGYTVSFTETGLPAGTQWRVSIQQMSGGVVTGYLGETTTTNEVTFLNQPGGMAKWNVSSSIPGATGIRYLPSTQNGTLQINSDTQIALESYATQYSVAFEPSPQAGGITNPSGSTNWYDTGSIVSIGETNDSGYAFTMWSASTASISLSSTSSQLATATIGGPGTITANYIPTVVELLLNSTAGAVRAGDSIQAGFIVIGAPQEVTLSSSGLPMGASLSFQSVGLTDSVLGSADELTITTTASVTPGSYVISLTALGANGQSAGTAYSLSIISASAELVMLPSSGDAGSVTLSTSAGDFVEVSSVAVASLPQTGSPDDVAFPYGMFSWTVDGLSIGQTIVVTLTFPSPVDSNSQYWKVIDGAWVNETSLIKSVSGDSLSISIKDGGQGDEDGAANGQITDPGGVGFVANAVTSTMLATIPKGQASGVAYDPANGLLYVTEYSGPTSNVNVSVVDPATHSIVGSIPVEGVSYNAAIVYDPQNGYLYVEGNDGTISVIDGATNSVVNTIVVPGGGGDNEYPFAGTGGTYGGMVYDSQDGLLYIPGAISSIYAIDPSTGLVVGQIPIPNALVMGSIAYDSSNGLIYQSVVDSIPSNNGTIDVVNGTSGGVVAIIPMDGTPGTVVYDSVDHDVYFANSSETNSGSEAGLSVIDPTIDAVVSTIAVPTPAGSLEGSWGVFSQATDTLYISDGVHNLFAIDPTSDKVTADIPFTTSSVLSGLAVDTNNCDVYAVTDGGDPYSGYLSSVATGCSAGLPLPSAASAPANSASSLISVGSGPTSVALDTSNGEIFVANTGSDSVSIISAATGKIVTTISLVFSAHETAIAPTTLTYDPANGYVYVASYSTAAGSGGGGGTYAIISGKTNSIVSSGAYPFAEFGELEHYPQGSAFDAANNEVYLTSMEAGSVGNVYLIDSAGSGLSANGQVAYDPYGIAYDPSNGYLYVSSYTLSGSVSVLSDCQSYDVYAPSCPVVDTIPVGSAPTGEVYDPANGYIYVADAGSNAVTVIDGATDKVVTTLAVGEYPVALAYDPSASEVIVTNEGSGSLSFIDTSSNAVAATVQIGPHPDGIVYDTANCDLYVANNAQDGTVSVLTTSCGPTSSPQYQISFQSNLSSPSPTVSYALSNGTSGGGTTPFTIGIDSGSGSGAAPSPEGPALLSPDTVLSTIPTSLQAGAVFDPSNGYIYGLGPSSSAGVYPVDVINAESGAIVTSIVIYTGTLTESPQFVYDSLNGYVYFLMTAGGNSVVYVIDPSNNSILTTIGAGTNAEVLLLDPDNGQVYTASSNATGYTLYDIDGTTNAVMGTFTNSEGLPPGTADFVDSMAYDPANQEIYMMGYYGTLTAFSPGTQTFVLDVPGTGYSGYVVYGNGEIFVSPSDVLNTVSVYNAENELVAAIGVAPLPSTGTAPLYDAANGNLYVFCQGGEVDVISTSLNEVIDVIPINPSIVSPTNTLPLLVGDSIYLPDETDGLVAVIDTTTNAYLPGISTVVNTYALSFDPLTGTILASDGAVTLVLGAPLVVSPTGSSPSGAISISYAYESTLAGGTGTQYVLASIDPTSPQQVTGSFIVEGDYQEQYQVTFAQTGLDGSASGNILNVGGVQLPVADLPFMEYVNAGAQVDFAYSPTVSGAASGTFVLSGVTGNTTDDTVVMDAPTTVTATYAPASTSTSTTTVTSTVVSTSTITSSSTVSSTSYTTSTYTLTSTSATTETATSSSTVSTATTTLTSTTTTGACYEPMQGQDVTVTVTTTSTSTMTQTSVGTETIVLTTTVTTTVPTTLTTTTTSVVPVTVTQTDYSTVTVCSSSISTGSSSTTTTSSSSGPLPVPQFPLGFLLVFAVLIPLVLVSRLVLQRPRRTASLGDRAERLSGL